MHAASVEVAAFVAGEFMCDRDVARTRLMEDATETRRGLGRITNHSGKHERLSSADFDKVCHQDVTYIPQAIAPASYLRHPEYLNDSATFDTKRTQLVDLASLSLWSKQRRIA